MAVRILDVLGLKCPQPVLKLAAMAKEIPPGDTVEVLADCESFPKDVQVWCSKSGKTLLFCVDEGGGKHKAQIQF
ncbi:MAG: sulfurtransferase TusA family protein [Dehalococcoidia bacterium]|nr:MAG: sulfurtransferase TusA family protein [Dehalococcoidia bacterium]